MSLTLETGERNQPLLRPVFLWGATFGSVTGVRGRADRRPAKAPALHTALRRLNAFANGALSHEVSRWLGHKPTKVTADIYSTLIPEARDRYTRPWQTRSDFVRSVAHWMYWISFDGAGWVLDARAFLQVKASSWSSASTSRAFPSDHLIVGSGVALTDVQWQRIEPLLPDRVPKRGGRWRAHRQVIDAIAFKYRTGCPWMDLPEEFGSWKGVHNRLRKWAADGTWEKVFTALLTQADSEGDLDWVVAVDSTIVRAHQHAAGARQKGPRPASRTTMPSAGPVAD